MNIDGILYVIDVSKRDTIEPNKVSKFIKQLPWKY